MIQPNFNIKKFITSRFFFIGVVSFFAVFVGAIVFQNYKLFPYQQNIAQLSEEQVTAILSETREHISTPPPLIKTEIENQTEPDVDEQVFIKSFLTQEGVIQWTNIQREQYNLPPLRENAKLNASAQAKAQDMLERQYFAHISLSGIEVKNLAENVGYEFIAIGENLALGNFEGDQILVQAWMDSLGHRANILKTRYQEIGVAVVKGVFKEQSTWLAVQHFGMPLSACPQSEEALKIKIEDNKKLIEELLTTIETLETEIQLIRQPRRMSIDNQKIEEYNNLVLQYNTLIEETRNLINQYNSQVQIFNECATQ